MKNIDKNFYGTIYYFTNIIDNKQYFGQTIAKDIKKYIEAHFKAAQKGDKKLLYNAIRKHGPENFEWYVACYCGDALALSLMEDFCINVFNTLASKGYNLKGGGYHGKLSEEAKQNVSKGNIERFKDPKEREKASKGAIKRFKNPKEREKASKKAQKAWEKRLVEDPEKVSKIASDAAKKAWQTRKKNPEKMSKQMSEHWKKIWQEKLEKDPEAKSKNVKKGWQTRKKDLKTLNKALQKHKNSIENLPEIFCRYCNKKYKFQKSLDTHEETCDKRE